MVRCAAWLVAAAVLGTGCGAARDSWTSGGAELLGAGRLLPVDSPAGQPLTPDAEPSLDDPLAEILMGTPAAPAGSGPPPRSEPIPLPDAPDIEPDNEGFFPLPAVPAENRRAPSRRGRRGLPVWFRAAGSWQLAGSLAPTHEMGDVAEFANTGTGWGVTIGRMLADPTARRRSVWILELSYQQSDHEGDAVGLIGVQAERRRYLVGCKRVRSADASSQWYLTLGASYHELEFDRQDVPDERFDIAGPGAYLGFGLDRFLNASGSISLGLDVKGHVWFGENDFDGTGDEQSVIAGVELRFHL